MSKLEYYCRPLVAFDAYNKDHRRYYAEFLEYGGWGQCPVRFIVPESSGMDLTLMIKNEITNYYIDREFGGGKLSTERSKALAHDAEKLTKEAKRLQAESKLLLKPRRT